MERIYLNIEQGSEEWHESRLGRATSSKFDAVLTKGRGKDQEFGGTAMSYLYGLVAERFTGQWKEISGKPLQWGNDFEAMAIRAYEEQEWAKVEKIGFIQLGDFVGASTDGLVGADGMIEVKCPFASENHIDYYLNGIPKKYIPQVQGGLWVAEREWCDFISFDPRFIKKDFRIKVHRYYRDEAFIKTLSERVNRFTEILEEHIEKMENSLLSDLKIAV